MDGNKKRNSVPPPPKKSRTSGRQCHQGVLALPQAPVDGDMKTILVPPAPWWCRYSYFGLRRPAICLQNKYSSWKRHQTKSRTSGRQCHQGVLALPQAPVDGDMKTISVPPAPWWCRYSYFGLCRPAICLQNKHSSWKRHQRNPELVVGSVTKVF